MKRERFYAEDFERYHYSLPHIKLSASVKKKSHQVSGKCFLNFLICMIPPITKFYNRHHICAFLLAVNDPSVYAFRSL